MAKRKSEEARLRQVEQENKALRKKVSRLHKKSSLPHDIQEEPEHDEGERYKLHTKCPSCVKGRLESIDLGVRVLTVCNLCDYRMVEKK